MSHIIHVSEILMLNAIYHYYEVSGKTNFLDFLHTILSLLLYFYLSFNYKTKNQISFLN
jgi:hypothetical protein